MVQLAVYLVSACFGIFLKSQKKTIRVKPNKTKRKPRKLKIVIHNCKKRQNRLKIVPRRETANNRNRFFVDISVVFSICYDSREEYPKMTSSIRQPDKIYYRKSFLNLMIVVIFRKNDVR